MRQHNPNSQDRAYWKPRDRARLRARFLIQQRVARGDALPTNNEKETEDCATEDTDLQQEDQVLDLLNRIIDNDRSFFSLTSLEQNGILFSSPIPTDLVWETIDDDTLRGGEKLYSWYREGVNRFKTFLRELQSITPMEYAILFQRFHIVGSFIMGGINPCGRGNFRGEEQVPEDWLEEMHLVGCAVLHKIFEPTPVTLGSYICKRAFDLRLAAWEHSRLSALEDDTCSMCRRIHVPRSFRLLYDCEHSHLVCEPCYWRLALERLQHSEDGDVVACGVCSPVERKSELDHGLVPISETVRSKKLQETKNKFYKLPKDSDDLRQSGGRKRKKNGRFILASTWPEAVYPVIGSSQETRSDKFFGFIEGGSFHHVKGCLDAGIDPTLRNQYGQTGLHIASWRGHSRIVRKLLKYGSDPQALANGGTSPLDAAMRNGFVEIANVLRKYGGSESSCRPTYHLSLPENHLVVEEIIPPSLDHPGAGSYIIDGLLDDESTQHLVHLWESLPIADGRLKTTLCSERRYFCDVGGYITSLLNAVMHLVGDGKAGGKGKVVFLPFMRYLAYRDSGTVLAPHVDLSRVDLDSGVRSTHTFLLYLTDCADGGATTLLQSLTGEGRMHRLARISPRRGRLLLFPHACPHEGEEVVDVPKLLIRGEAILPRGGILHYRIE